MPPRSGRGRGRFSSDGQRSRRLGPAQRRNGFQMFRVKEDGVDATSVTRTEEEDDTGDRATLTEESISEGSESDEKEPLRQDTYSTLLQILDAGSQDAELIRKRRKLAHIAPDQGTQSERSRRESKNDGDLAAEDTQQAGLDEAIDEEAQIDDDGSQADSDSEEAMLLDPFQNHYARLEQDDLQKLISSVDTKVLRSQRSTITGGIRKVLTDPNGSPVISSHTKILKNLRLKKRLQLTGMSLYKALSVEAKDVADEIFDYRDIQYSGRSIENAASLRDMASLHALNHVFKTRDSVLKNNAKSNQDTGDTKDLRDQGFTRPKVLILVPTKEACARYIESIVKLSRPEQQENKSRFSETFSSRLDEESWANKTEDFRELFGGNHEEDFRVGLKFTRKTIKYFSGFYNSDIVFGSALGLMRTITTGGSGKDKKKGHDADFLSSIEIVVVDHASAIQMQNWQHLLYVFSQLNQLPKDSHGCDFSRVRNWYLDGAAKYLRQTIVFTAYHTPEINSLMSSHAFNISGVAKYTPSYAGAMVSLPPYLPYTPSQTFLRLDANNPSNDSDARFTYFTTSILPSLLRHHQKGVLLFIPTYADFTRIRNHFSTSAATTSLSFGTISEYTPVRDVGRARSHFMNGRHSVLLYSERAHHYFRYKLRGVRRIVWYGVPENPTFWAEVVGMLALNPADMDDADVDEKGHRAKRREADNINGKGAVRALFSKWDAMKLERIVGTARVGKLINDKGGDTFEFT